MTRKILLAFDGTLDNARDFIASKESGRDFSNVLKLHLLAGGSIDMKRNDIENQICLYKRGIGGESTNKDIALANAVLGILSQQTVPMRRMLEKVYEKGDELYIVAFSRGSASAREFVVELDELGIKTASGETVAKPPVKFLGCFDTVSEQVEHEVECLWDERFKLITKPSVLHEKDGKLSSIVETAVHQVSMEDNRQFKGSPAFPPVLMDSKDERVHEIWFPGEHGDVGGSGYLKGLADGSLQAMKEWMEKCGLKFLEKGEDIHPDCVKIDVKGFEHLKVDRSRMNIKPDPSYKPGWMHPQQKYEPSYRLTVAITNEAVIPGATLRIHKSYLEHIEAMANEESAYSKVNRELFHCADIVVVGALGKKLEDETKRLKDIIAKQKYAANCVTHNRYEPARDAINKGATLVS